MFNICNESQNRLQGIINEYLASNQESENLFLQHVQQAENAFFNHWKQLNQLRIQSQAQNWLKFMNQLQQIPAKPLHINTNTNTNPFPMININTNNTNAIVSNTSITPLSSKVNSARSTTTTTNRQRRAKSNEEYKCPRSECTKCYTTKGNLNRHLKDFHRVNGIDKQQSNGVKVECNECSQCFMDNDALKEHQNEVHTESKVFKAVTPPKKPTPPQRICPAPPTVTAPKAFTVSNTTNHNPFSAQSVPTQQSYPTVLNLNNNNKALHLPMFDVNPKNGSNLNTKLTMQQRTVNPFAMMLNNGNTKSNNNVLQILANNIKNGGKVMHLSPINSNKKANSFSSMPKFIKNGRKDMKSTYTGLDMLLQAADALDKRKSDSVSSDTTDESDRERRRSRKRKSESTDDDYDPKQDRNPPKRRKINNDTDAIKRVDADFKSGVCSLCKKTQKEKNTSNYNWKNHLESDHKYPCNQCERRYTKPKYLDTHLQEVHHRAIV